MVAVACGFLGSLRRPSTVKTSIAGVLRTQLCPKVCFTSDVFSLCVKDFAALHWSCGSTDFGKWSDEYFIQANNSI